MYILCKPLCLSLPAQRACSFLSYFLPSLVNSFCATLFPTCHSEHDLDLPLLAFRFHFDTKNYPSQNKCNVIVSLDFTSLNPVLSVSEFPALQIGVLFCSCVQFKEVV
jgi:hypothetical protein